MITIHRTWKISLALLVCSTWTLAWGAPAASADWAYKPWPTAVAFDGVPPRASPKPGSACEIANQYVTLIFSDRASEVPKLFAADGEFIGPEDRVLRGPAEIATFYDKVHQPGAIPLSFIDNGHECIMELAGKRPNDRRGMTDVYKLVAIDHFTVAADRKIRRLVIFFRQNPIAPAPATR